MPGTHKLLDEYKLYLRAAAPPIDTEIGRASFRSTNTSTTDLSTTASNLAINEEPSQFTDEIKAAYNSDCAALLSEFKTIVSAYSDHHEQGTGLSGYFNGALNQIRFHQLFNSPEAHAFASLIEALCLIDGFGVWLKQIYTQLNDCHSFDYGNQERLLATLGEMFVALQSSKEKEMTTRLATLQQESVTLAETTNPLTAGLIESGEGETPLTPLLRAQWDNEKAELDRQLKLFKKNICHLSETLVLNKPLARAALDETSTLAWQPPYIVNSDDYEEPSPEKLTKRSAQQRNQSISTNSARIIAVGEACIAITGGSSSHALTHLLSSNGSKALVGLCAWHINYLLFKGDIDTCLNDFFIRKDVEGTKYPLLFLKDGAPITKHQQYITYASIIACLAVGLVYGAVNFVSTRDQLPLLFQSFGYKDDINPLLLNT